LVERESVDTFENVERSIHLLTKMHLIRPRITVVTRCLPPDARVQAFVWVVTPGLAFINVFELYRYDGVILTSSLPQSRPFRKRGSNLRKKEREASSIYRSKKRLKRLINSNVGFH
jgi:hypothetical protein